MTGTAGHLSQEQWIELVSDLARDAEKVDCEASPTALQISDLAVRFVGLNWVAMVPRWIAASCRASLAANQPLLASLPASVLLLDSDEIRASFRPGDAVENNVARWQVGEATQTAKRGRPRKDPLPAPEPQAAPEPEPEPSPTPEPEPAQQLEAVETVIEVAPEPEPEPAAEPDPEPAPEPETVEPVPLEQEVIEPLPEPTPPPVQLVRVSKPLRPASERMQRRWAGGPQSELLAARARQRRAAIAAARDPNQPEPAPKPAPKPRQPAAPKPPKPAIELPAGWFKTSEVAELIGQNASNCLQSLRLRIQRGVLQEGEHYRRIGGHMIWSPAAIESLEKRLPKPDRGWPDGWLGVYELAAHLGRNADHLCADLSRWRRGGLLLEGEHYQAWPGKPSRIWSVAAMQDFLEERKSSRHKQLADLEALLAEIRSEDATEAAVDSDADSDES